MKWKPGCSENYFLITQPGHKLVNNNKVFIGWFTFLFLLFSCKHDAALSQVSNVVSSPSHQWCKFLPDRYWADASPGLLPQCPSLSQTSGLPGPTAWYLSSRPILSMRITVCKKGMTYLLARKIILRVPWLLTGTQICIMFQDGPPTPTPRKLSQLYTDST